MSVITKLSPYYDDYDPEDGFHRILFKPGQAVQARELTQLQTILQNQISSLGDYIVDDGIVIQGASITENPNARSIRLANTATVSNYLNLYVGGANSNVVGKVVSVFEANSPNDGDPPTIIINWIGTGDQGRSKNGITKSNETLRFHNTVNAAINSYFISGVYQTNTLSNTIVSVSASVDQFSKVLTLPTPTSTIKAGDYVNHPSLLINDYDTGLYVAKVVSTTELELNKPASATVSGTIEFIRESTQIPLYVNATSGIVYKNGFFVQTPSANIVADKYNLSSYKGIGIDLEFQNLDYVDNPELLDPAVGSTNYFAPGADRLKANVTYVAVDLDTNNNPDRGLYDNFIPVKNYLGEYSQYVNRVSVQSGISKELAERTYLESGNYAVNPLGFQTEFSVASSNVTYVTKGGTYFIGGNLVKVSPQKFLIGKARDTKVTTASSIATKFGKYTLVENFANSIINPGNVDIYANVEIHGSYDQKNRIGTATIKSIDFDEEKSIGNSKVYKLYFHRVNMETNTFANARSFAANISGNFVFRANVNNQSFARVTDGTQLFNTERKNSFFGLLNSRVAGVHPNSLEYYYRKTSKNQSFASGSATISLSSNEFFVGSTGAGNLTGDTLNTNYTMTVVSGATGTTLKGQYNLTPAVASLSTSQQLLINTGDAGFNGVADVLYTVRVRGQYGDVSYRTKTLTSKINLLDFLRTGNVGNAYVSLTKSDVFNLVYANTLPASNTFVGMWAAATDYKKGNVVGHNNVIYYCNVTQTGTGDAAFNSANFSPLGADPLSNFELDNGQRDSYYDHGRVANLTSYSASFSNVAVIFNYFTHTGTGPIVANTYTNAGIEYSNIPIYKNEDGGYIPLTDVIDFRPRRVDDKTDFVLDPAIIPANYSEYPLSADVSFYVPRTDSITLNKYGKIIVHPGKPGITAPAPILNLDDSEEIILGVASIAPYTTNKNEIRINLIPRRRYTMKDIAALERRINDLTILVSKVVNAGNKVTYITDDAPDRTPFTVKSYFTEDFFTNSVPSRFIDTTLTTATYDVNSGSLGPGLKADTQTYTLDTTSSITNSSNIITMNYTTDSIIRNLEASPDGPLTINPSEIKSFQGRLIITPQASPLINQTLTNGLDSSIAQTQLPTYSSISFNNLNQTLTGSTADISTVINTNLSSDAETLKNALQVEVKTAYGTPADGINFSRLRVSRIKDIEE